MGLGTVSRRAAALRNQLSTVAHGLKAFDEREQGTLCDSGTLSSNAKPLISTICSMTAISA